MVVVAHLSIAMALVATLVVASIRAGAMGGSATGLMGGTPKAARGALAAAGLGFVVLVMGALTANLPGAASACTGFPLCRNGFGVPMQSVQLTHRIFAFLLLFHTIGLVVMMGKRREPGLMRRAGAIALTALVVQVLVAAAMVEMGLPLVLRAAHQAVGTLAWVALVTLAALARRSAAVDGETLRVSAAGVPTFQAGGGPRPTGAGA